MAKMRIHMCSTGQVTKSFKDCVIIAVLLESRASAQRTPGRPGDKTQKR